MNETETLSALDARPEPTRLLDALASLDEIGAAVNRLSPRDGLSVRATLRLIADSAIQVVPGASAVIYTYDVAEQAFDLDSRVAAGESGDTATRDDPRPGGIGARAIRQRRRVLSYEEPDLAIHPAKVQAGAQAMACFPLMVANQVVGALYVYLNAARRFDPLELLLLDIFVNQAAMAIYQARRLSAIQRDLARKEEELSRLRRAGLLLSSRLSLDETLEAILEMALEVTGAHYGIFRLVDEGGRSLEARAVAGPGAQRPQLGALPLDSSSIMGWVAEHRQPLCIHDLHAAPWVRVYQPLYADLSMQSELAVPLVGSSGRLEGVLNLESPVVGAFGEQDSLLLQSLATQAVIAIQEARLLDALLAVAQRLLLHPFQAVLDHLTALSCDLLNTAAGAIWTLDGESLVLRSASAGHRHGERLPLHDSLTGRAILEARPVLSHDVLADPRFHRADLARAQRWSRALIVPLHSSVPLHPSGPLQNSGPLDQRRPIGAFSVYSTADEPGRFTQSEWDVKVLTCLAHYAALALLNAEQQRALRAAQEQRAVAETFAAVGDIAANVLHHLNNKVGTIPVRVQGIEDKCAPALLEDGYLAKNLGEIERSAREAMAQVRQNLTHLRPIHPAPVDVAACVREAADAARLPTPVRLEVVGLDALPPVVASKHSLTLVFANLLENAADAMQGQGRIRIVGAAGENAVTLSVSDDGPGIAPALHERIFEFSFSGRKHPGRLGFGLWWVKTLMVRLGGSIAVESDGVRGTTFRLRLPRMEATA